MHGGVGVGWEQPPSPHAGSPPCQFLPSSEDYGKTFKDITSLINNTFIRTEFGMAIGPENSGKVGGAACQDASEPGPPVCTQQPPTSGSLGRGVFLFWSSRHG